MIIQHNASAMSANRNLGITLGGLQKSAEKLSSGYRINRAGDDAAGLAISEKMRGQIRGLNQASTNAQDGISLIQTAEGALGETHEILQRMRELAVQAASDTNTKTDREKISLELTALTDEITRIASTTEFNTMKLIDGSKSADADQLTFQIGANKAQTIKIGITAVHASALELQEKVNSSLSISSNEEAGVAIEKYDAAIQKVSEVRAKLGAVQNRLEHTVANLDVSAENLQISESRIRDVNMAKEMTKYSKNNILLQAGQSMLAQANQQTQGVLSLLR